MSDHGQRLLDYLQKFEQVKFILEEEKPQCAERDRELLIKF